jgi:hypothetical protein
MPETFPLHLLFPWSPSGRTRLTGSVLEMGIRSARHSVDSTAIACTRIKGRPVWMEEQEVPGSLLAPADSESPCPTLAAGAMPGQRSSLLPHGRSMVVFPVTTRPRTRCIKTRMQKHSVTGSTHVIFLKVLNNSNMPFCKDLILLLLCHLHFKGMIYIFSNNRVI